MAAPSKSWNTVTDGQVDADSPLDTTLMTAMRDNLVHLEEWMGGSYTAAVDHTHDGTDSALITDLGTNVVGSDSLSYTAGDVLIASDDGLAVTANAAYTLIKEFTIARSGELRIKHRMGISGTPTSVESKIYRNGSPVGTERQLIYPSGDVDYSEDISGWTAGDTVQIYGKVTPGGGAPDVEIRNFRLYNEYPVVIS